MSKHNRDGLVELFGKLEKAILISTPAVEVGVDFDADTLITEECDGNGFLQRFGRVGRSGGIGQVSVLPPKSRGVFLVCVSCHQRCPETSFRGASLILMNLLTLR